VSHNSFVRPAGVWGSNLPVTHIEFAKFDLAQFQSVNGDAGGTFAPTSPIVIGGAGTQLAMIGTSTVGSGGSLTINAGSSFTLAAASSASFGGTSTYLGTSVTNHNSGAAGHWLNGSILHIDSGAQLDVTGDAFFNNGSFVDIEGTVSFGSTAALTVNCASDFVGAATFDAGLTVTAGNFAVLGGTTSLGGTNHIVGPTLVSVPLTMTGAGRPVRQAVIGAASGGGTADPSVATTYYFSSVTADQVYTIVNTNAADGDELEFWTESTTNSVSVHDPPRHPDSVNQERRWQLLLDEDQTHRRQLEIGRTNQGVNASRSHATIGPRCAHRLRSTCAWSPLSS
jgi:hypothetical protein